MRRVGVFYNGRQVIEAGIALYQEMVLFVKNLIRWFRRQFVGGSVLAAASIIELVRIGANSSAQIILEGRAILLTFAADSPWAGISLPLRPQITYQLWFPFLEDYSLFVRAGP